MKEPQAIHWGPHQKAFVVKGEESRIQGVLRLPPNCRKLVVMVPALTGTRTGPQRIFVDISHHLFQQEIGTLTLDLPPNGDSYDWKHSGVRKWKDLEELNAIVALYLGQVREQLDELEVPLIWMSISWGCIPVATFARENGFEEAILLSPSTIVGKAQKVDASSLRTYYLKLFRRETWGKILRFQIRPRRIFYTIFPKQRPISQGASGSPSASSVGHLDRVLCLYGGNDPEKDRYKAYWEAEKASGRIKHLDEAVVPNADHSFMGWKWKQEVALHVGDWMEGKEVGNGV